MVQRLTREFQAAHPDVLANIVMDPAVDIYSFSNLQGTVFTAGGYDVVEIDTVFLQWLKDGGMISPVAITGDQPFPVGLQAATLNGQVFGVPSWLCSDFLFSTSPKVETVKTFDQLRGYIDSAQPQRGIVGDFNGTWTIPALYLQSYIQNHPGGSPTGALTAPIDAASVSRMTRFGGYCNPEPANDCINNFFHSEPDGSVEKAFDAGYAVNDLGFSERSFYIALYQSVHKRLYLTPLPWGTDPAVPRMVYSDAFVVNKLACAGTCASDANTFAAFMTSAVVKKEIALSADLPSGDPSRHLIVATKPFFDDPAIKSDPFYSKLLEFLQSNPVPYTTGFNPRSQYQLLSGLCPALKAQQAGWVCKVPAPPK
jgi:hypothetical protein